MIPTFTSEMDADDALEPAMFITDPVEAAAYFEAYVWQLVTEHGESQESAEALVRNNLAVYSHDYDIETQNRVRRLWKDETRAKRLDALLEYLRLQPGG